MVMSTLTPGWTAQSQPGFSRREMLRRTSTGFGMLALSALMADPAYAGLVPRPARESAGPQARPS